MPGPVSTGMGDCVGGSTPSVGKSISVYNQLSRSTEAGHASMGRCNEYWLKGGDALWLGRKGR